MKKYPSISIIARTLNTNLPMFTRVLESVKMQKYPKKLIEYLVMDGGSTNGTVELAKKYGCKVIKKDIEDEARAGWGIKIARGDIILDLESDNIITSDDWFLKMVKPFMEYKEIFFTYSAYNSYENDMSLTTKYCALFGSTDPLLYYLGKSEKIPLAQKEYNKGIIIQNKPDYYVVKFDKDNLPTLGANGHMFRRDVISKVIKDPKDYTHTDAVMDMLDLGFDTFGVVKNSIIHVANPSIMGLVRRRVEVKKSFYDKRRGKRKYLVFNWKSGRDRLNLIKFVFFSLTFVFPLYESIRGYMKIRDRAWFLHPVLSFIMFFAYGISELQWLVKRMSK